MKTEQEQLNKVARAGAIGGGPKPVRTEGVRSGMRMLHLLASIASTSARWRSLALVLTVAAATIGEVVLMLRLTTWNADFFDLLQQKSISGLLTQTWIFFAIVLGIMLMQAMNLETKLRLQLALRSHLTKVILDI
jgi:vitamin B12/bleomycin/antimicrobial peptide transport system ATP-binding/permease protein